jgi:hypothetical protein
MAEWDPIGVGDIPEAADEYDGYIGGIYKLLDQGSSEGALYSHLRQIEIGQMEMIDGIGEPLMSEGKRRAAVSSLIDLRRYFTKPS